MKTKPKKIDERPRFGWCEDLDNEPQLIREKKGPTATIPVVVIPLPFMSSKQSREIRDFAKIRIWPREETNGLAVERRVITGKGKIRAKSP